jgi:hypothetical protein
MTAPVPAVAARKPARSVNTRVLGGVLLVFGSGWLVEQVGLVHLGWTAIWSFVLIALGLGMIITSRTKSTSVPLVLVGAALTAGLALGTSDIGLRGGVGQEVNRPSLTSGKPADFSLAVGELIVDLKEVGADGTIDANVGVGHLVVRVPKNVRVKGTFETRMGGADIFGARVDWDERRHGKINDPIDEADADRTVTLDLHVGLGQIEVVRAGD